ncbi:928_t:CDS:2, partial [Entrophospora sp. SA101]
MAIMETAQKSQKSKTNNFTSILDQEEWLNWVADNDTETIIENELYDNDEVFINTSSNEINNLQNPSTPNKKRLL